MFYLKILLQRLLILIAVNMLLFANTYAQITYKPWTYKSNEDCSDRSTPDPLHLFGEIDPNTDEEKPITYRVPKDGNCKVIDGYTITDDDTSAYNENYLDDNRSTTLHGLTTSDGGLDSIDPVRVFIYLYNSSNGTSLDATKNSADYNSVKDNFLCYNSHFVAKNIVDNGNKSDSSGEYKECTGIFRFGCNYHDSVSCPALAGAGGETSLQSVDKDQFSTCKAKDEAVAVQNATKIDIDFDYWLQDSETECEATGYDDVVSVVSDGVTRYYKNFDFNKNSEILYKMMAIYSNNASGESGKGGPGDYKFEDKYKCGSNDEDERKLFFIIKGVTHEKLTNSQGIEYTKCSAEKIEFYCDNSGKPIEEACATPDELEPESVPVPNTINLDSLLCSDEAVMPDNNLIKSSYVVKGEVTFKVIGKTCSNLNIGARMSIDDNPEYSSRIADMRKNGRFYVSSSGWPLQWFTDGKPGNYRIHHADISKYKDLESLGDAISWDGSGGDAFSNGTCPDNSGYYYLFYQTKDVKDKYDPNGDAADCPISAFAFVCEPEGSPDLQNDTGSCDLPNKPEPEPLPPVKTLTCNMSKSTEDHAFNYDGDDNKQFDVAWELPASGDCGNFIPDLVHSQRNYITDTHQREYVFARLIFPMEPVEMGTDGKYRILNNDGDNLIEDSQYYFGGIDGDDGVGDDSSDCTTKKNVMYIIPPAPGTIEKQFADEWGNIYDNNDNDDPNIKEACVGKYWIACDGLGEPKCDHPCSPDPDDPQCDDQPTDPTGPKPENITCDVPPEGDSIESLFEFNIPLGITNTNDYLFKTDGDGTQDYCELFATNLGIEEGEDKRNYYSEEAFKIYAALDGYQGWAEYFPDDNLSVDETQNYLGCSKENIYFTIDKGFTMNPEFSGCNDDEPSICWQECNGGSINFYCDTKPLTNNDHQCNYDDPPPPPDEPDNLCGNKSLDPDEECDPSFINQSLDGSLGCNNDCTISTDDPTWSCTKNMDEYNAKQAEAKTIYGELKDKQTDFNDKNCDGNTSDDNEIWCSNYENKVKYFKQLNAVIPVDCTDVRSFGTRNDGDYTVNCNDGIVQLVPDGGGDGGGTLF